MSAPLYGLVLAGGASTRMQRDKAALLYHDRPQLDWTYDLLSEVCERVFVSVRQDQVEDEVRNRFPKIVDRLRDKGPIAGIAAAQAEVPEAAWLVVACDLPKQTAYNMVKTMAGNVGGMAAVVKAIEGITPKDMALDIGVPFHKGAARFYKEVGAL